ncbi:MAG: hypothetical protein MUF49_10600 [Oculatellaceae cyanobacterium Prado106]|jgi:hypothetical protein|nr:hypothetical protein [Oculatellaceae cyanobacterium Prado106]
MATAEDGGNLNHYEAQNTIQIGRNFAAPAPTRSSSSYSASANATLNQIDAEESTAAHARSVRDLYPCRVTEIADLAKIFMSATAVLRLYLETSEVEQQTEPKARQAAAQQVEQLNHDFTIPLSNLHQEDRCKQPMTADRLKQQPRYNGHLYPFLERCKRELRREFQQVRPLTHLEEIQTHRKRILKVLFDGLYQDQD